MLWEQKSVMIRLVLYKAEKSVWTIYSNKSLIAEKHNFKLNLL